MTDIFKTLQNDIIKLAKSQETDFLPLIKSVYGDTPEAVLKGALFASYIYKENDKEQKKILLECDDELKSKGSLKHKKKFNQMFPNVSEKKSTPKTAQSTPEPHIVIPKEIYKESLENAVRVKEFELQVAHNDEKIKLYEQIDGLQNKLANLPESLKKAQKKNAELVDRLEKMGSKPAEKKFQKATDALKENEFAKADKILIEIEETETLNKKNFGKIAYARGQIAEHELRWHDAAKHYARAAQFDPCYRNLILAEKFAIDTGDYDSALSLGEEAKKAAIKEHGEDSKEHATSLNNLGTVYSNKKQYKKAKLLYEESLKIRQDILEKKHPDIATSLNSLGVIYQEQEQHREATYFLKRSLNIYKEAFGMKHPRTADVLSNLGAAYRELGEFTKAKPLIKRALNIRKEIFGDNHPDIANSYNNLGGLYIQKKQYKKAEPYFRQALEILETTLGPDHPHTILVKGYYEKTKKVLANT